MNLQKQDLHKIGHTITPTKEGGTSFICSPDTCRIESILLREILLLFGDYKIISEDDFIWDNGVCDWEIITNLPYEIYMDI